VTVGQLCSGLSGLKVAGDSKRVISRITVDSRQAGTDTLFVAVPGTSGDGHDYLDKALALGAGAVAIQEDRFNQVSHLLEGYTGVVLRVDKTRPLPALLGRRLNGNPDASLLTAAVTGTNGKTTVSFLMREMLNRLHGPCGLMGTIAYDDGKTSVPAPLTTPDGTVFYAWLGRMVENGCRSVAMELSSHGLDQDRTAGLELDVAVMTNLGRDHLDYHRDLDEYLAAKARIMDLLRDGISGRQGTVVMNQDDAHLASLDTGQAKVVRFSLGNPVHGSPDLAVVSSQLELTGTRLQLDWRGTPLEITSPLVGRFNLENLTAALAAGLALGLDPAACAEALGGVPQVPGRMERFILPGGGLAVVDYAHTHDALAAVLGTCDELSTGSLLVVFGCGGDRDRGKRPLMGRVAARESDQAWVTSDNPRGEEPGGIIRDILKGFDEVREPRAVGREMVIDRKEAIEAALSVAGPGDIVVVAGKGHEDYQLVGDRILELDDRVIIKDWIKGNRHHG
jgi:UDP-N-acetylmuramoyl-L-alanyl-D-glutamate--2,6-diaminopimelate ligase